jgi:hypothetical protein
MKKWDVFISHASEDKQAVALPLADSLTRSGLKVWLDRFELRIGDSLREKIDEGLAESAFGVVILSEHFFNKGWTKNELNGLFALEDGGVKLILPVWHGVDKATVAKYSPILADRLAANTTDGIRAIAQMIAQVVLESGAIRPGSATLASQFINIANQGPEPLNVSTFLRTYPTVLETALGFNYSLGSLYKVRPDLGGFCPDLSVGVFEGTSGGSDWWHCCFSPAKGHFFNKGTPAGELGIAVNGIERVLKWLTEHCDDAERILGMDPSEQGRHNGLILVGRRDALSDTDRKGIVALKSRGLDVHSYDWLIEACIAVAERAQGSR